MKKHSIEIIPFETAYANHFYDLNIEWLETYFYVEPYDKKVLENPKSCIIDTNGYIFFAKIHNKIVGTFALINQKECYELSKMAVSPKYRGMKIGEQMLSFCISFSRRQQWKHIMLYSNTKLKPAIHLYKKLGFIEVSLEKDVIYKRSDIKMRLKL